MSIEVLVTTPFPENLIDRLVAVSPKINVTAMAVQNVNEIPAEIWKQAEVLYTGHVLPNPEMAPSLQWIQFHFAGIDRFIDELIFKKNGLRVTTLSGAATIQIGEHVVSMMLALSRRLPAMLASQKKSEWPKDRFERFAPFELYGKTVGIVGYGSIGRQIARLLQPFGVNVLATKRNAMKPTDDGYIAEGLGDPKGDFIKRLYPPQALKSMLRECHFVIITVPLTRETENLINGKMLSALKPGSYLVDITRGGIVNINDVLDALKSGHLAGAALDVFPEEPLPQNNPVWQTPGLIITPHISGGSVHYNERAISLFSENLLRYLSDLPLYNQFDPSRGY